MNEEQLTRTIASLGVTKIQKRGEWLMGCCPIHGESRPSWGINLDPPHRCNCFGCSYQAYSLARLMADVQDIPLERAREIVGDKTNGEFQLPRGKIIRDYEEVKKSRFELPRTFIAPFRSGIETHEDFFKRGFTEKTAINFKVGYDRFKKRITVPIYYEDNTLAGVLGRTVVNNEVKWLIYENFPRHLIFPENKVKYDDWFIVVEGPYDVMWMHQLGFKNTIGIMTASITKQQADWIAERASYVVCMLDNPDIDEAGKEGGKRLLKYMRRRGVHVYFVKYPKGRKDPQECNKIQIEKMLRNKKSWYNKKIDRIS